MKKLSIIALIITGIIVYGSTVYIWAQELGDPGFEALNGKTISRDGCCRRMEYPGGSALCR